MVSIVVGGMLLGFVIALFGITHPLGELVAVLQKMAKGEDIDVVGADRKDEIGDTARAVTAIRTMIAEKTAREAAEKAEADRVAMTEKSERDRLSAEQKLDQDKRAAARARGGYRPGSWPSSTRLSGVSPRRRWRATSRSACHSRARKASSATSPRR